MTHPSRTPIGTFPALILASALLTGCQGLGGKSYDDQRSIGGTRGGKADGNWTWFWKDQPRVTQAKGYYHLDKQKGPWRYFHEDGETLQWNGQLGEEGLHALSRFWYPDGTLEARGVYDGGVEVGTWSFFDASGNRILEADYSNGSPSGVWEYWRPDGSRLARGMRMSRKNIGTWSYWDEAGNEFAEAYELPTGFALVDESGSGGAGGRTGLMKNGRKSGRWILRHGNGERSAAGDFKDGVATGTWVIYDTTGSPVASGPVANGRPTGNWYTYDGDRADRVAARKLDDHIEDALDLASRPARAVDRAPSNLSRPADHLVEATLQPPRIPMRPQPWTRREEESMDFLLAFYDDRVKARAQAPKENDYGSLVKKREPDGDEARQAPLIGRQLGHTEVYGEAGTPLDIDKFKGDRNVVLVILRGRANEICVYCVTQTTVLANNYEEIRAKGAEVVVVYPGSMNSFNSFLEALGSIEANEGAEPPFPMVFDADFTLVKDLEIEGKLALPTTLILDKSGAIQYAYVGEDDMDRPDMVGLMKALDEIQ